MGHKSYTDGLKQRLGSRPARSLADCYREHWSSSGLPQREVLELFELIEFIYRIPAGTLRPEDPIELLTGPVPARTWWRDHFHDLYAGDNELWLADELSAKLRAHHIEAVFDKASSIDDLAKAWCGLVPTAKGTSRDGI